MNRTGTRHGQKTPPSTSFPRLVAYWVPQQCNLDGISVNIQEENSARYFLVQSECKQTLVSVTEYNICDRIWEKVHYGTTTIFLYKHCCSKTRTISYSLKKYFFCLGIYNSLPTLTPNLRTERPSNWSSMLLKDGYLNLHLHSKNVVKRGWEGRKKWLK